MRALIITGLCFFFFANETNAKCLSTSSIHKKRGNPAFVGWVDWNIPGQVIIRTRGDALRAIGWPPSKHFHYAYGGGADPFWVLVKGLFYPGLDAALSSSRRLPSARYLEVYRNGFEAPKVGRRAMPDDLRQEFYRREYLNPRSLR